MDHKEELERLLGISPESIIGTHASRLVALFREINTEVPNEDDGSFRERRAMIKNLSDHIINIRGTARASLTPEEVRQVHRIHRVELALLNGIHPQRNFPIETARRLVRQFQQAHDYLARGGIIRAADRNMHESLAIALLRIAADNVLEINIDLVRDLILFREKLAVRVQSSLEAGEWSHNLDRDEDKRRLLADLERVNFAPTITLAMKAEIRRAAIFRLYATKNIDELPEDRRMCPICLRDYGITDAEEKPCMPRATTCCPPATVGHKCLLRWMLEHDSCGASRCNREVDLRQVMNTIGPGIANSLLNDVLLGELGLEDGLSWVLLVGQDA